MVESARVWLAGATGLVGRETLNMLLEDRAFSSVLAPVRRPLGLSHPKLDARVVDFEALEPALHNGANNAAEIAICCLGTTIKQAGSQEKFRRVDHDYVLAFARAARAAGVQHFMVVTALGSNAKSLTFYNRVKGEVEAALGQLGFPALTIARPSLLLGDRTEFRFGERVFAPVAKLLPGKLRGIEASTVARALVVLARAPARGTRVVPSDELQTLGR
ncbi:MAG: NAD(P)H-binding protein [Myxococcales bacterium]